MISIKEAKEIREQYNYTQLVILGVKKDGSQCIATSGDTTTNAQCAADLGNYFKKKLDWPDKKCHTKPLERICKKCSFWKDLHYDRSEPIPYYLKGLCYYEPVKADRCENDISCIHFDPNC